MKRLSGAVLILGLLLLCSAAALADVFPSVTYVGFNTVTYEYTYRIDCLSTSTYPFGQLEVFAEVPNFGIYAVWQLSMDTPPSTLWATSTAMWQLFPERKDKAMWAANTSDDVVPAETLWSGQFYLIVPNSTPTGGIVVTLDGGPGATNPSSTTVPGPAPIPEPSSLLALGAMAGALMPLIRRRG